MGLTGGLGHYFVARAYYSAPASVVSPFNYVQLLGAALMDYVVFRDPPGLTLWLGAGLIIGSGLFIAYAERRGSRKTPPRPPPEARARLGVSGSRQPSATDSPEGSGQRPSRAVATASQPSKGISGGTVALPVVGEPVGQDSGRARAGGPSSGGRRPRTGARPGTRRSAGTPPRASRRAPPSRGPPPRGGRSSRTPSTSDSHGTARGGGGGKIDCGHDGVLRGPPRPRPPAARARARPGDQRGDVPRGGRRRSPGALHRAPGRLRRYARRLDRLRLQPVRRRARAGVAGPAALLKGTVMAASGPASWSRRDEAGPGPHAGRGRHGRRGPPRPGRERLRAGLPVAPPVRRRQHALGLALLAQRRRGQRGRPAGRRRGRPDRLGLARHRRRPGDRGAVHAVGRRRGPRRPPARSDREARWRGRHDAASPINRGCRPRPSPPGPTARRARGSPAGSGAAPRATASGSR